jgi:hypothetical protein
VRRRSAVLTLLAGRSAGAIESASTRQTAAPLGIVGVLLALALVVNAGRRPRSQQINFDAAAPKRHLIGIDSLRLDQLRRFGGSGVTPHLDDFIAKADIVRDTTTPVARTYRPGARSCRAGIR